MLNFVKNLLLKVRYNTIRNDKDKKIWISVESDGLAKRLKPGYIRLIKLGSRTYTVVFDRLEYSENNIPVGHYYTTYATQYISFAAYCDLMTGKFGNIKVHL